MYALLEFWTKGFTSEGRTSCRDYLLCNLVYRVLFGVLLWLGIDNEGVCFILTVFFLFSLIPSLFLIIRRLHDTNKMGAYFCFSFIPIFGALVVFVWTLVPGDSGTNRFGRSPVYKNRLIEDMSLLNSQWKMAYPDAKVEDENVVKTSMKILEYSRENQCENILTEKIEEKFVNYTKKYRIPG